MKTCVIGEADPFIARLLKRFAAESGLQTVVARVGQDVVELARQVKPVGRYRGSRAARYDAGAGRLCEL